MQQLKLIPDEEQPASRPGPAPPEPLPAFGGWLRGRWGSDAQRLSSQKRGNEYKTYERVLFDHIERGLPVKDLALTNLAVHHWYPLPEKVQAAMLDALEREQREIEALT